MATRIEAIDIIKGIAIIAVVLGHVLVDMGLLNAWVYAFQVPLFFFASGLVFSPKLGFGATVAKRLRQLMLPYLGFGLLAILAYQVLGALAATLLGRGAADLGWLDCLFGLAYGNAARPELFFYRPLWFLPCLFVMELLVWGFAKLAEKAVPSPRRRAAVLAGCVLVATGAGFGYLNLVGVPLPWGLETAFILSPFFVAGYCCKLLVSAEAMDSRMQIGRNRAVAALTGVGCLVAGMALAWWDFTICGHSMSYAVNSYGVEPLFFAAALLHCAAAYLLCFALRHARLLSYLGQHTLYILGLHKYPILIFQLLPVTAGLLAQNNLLAVLPAAALAIAFSIAAEKLLKPAIAWVAGILGLNKK